MLEGNLKMYGADMYRYTLLYFVLNVCQGNVHSLHIVVCGLRFEAPVDQVAFLFYTQNTHNQRVISFVPLFKLYLIETHVLKVKCS